MTTIKTLKEIEVYLIGLKLAKKIYSLSRISPLSKDYSLVNQLRRACLSVPANIAEGFGRKSKKDFAHFLSIALGSTNELMAYLDFISLEYKIDINLLLQEYDFLCRKIYKFRSYLLLKN